MANVQTTVETCYHCGSVETDANDVLLFEIPGSDGEMWCEPCADKHDPCTHCKRAPCDCDRQYDEWKDREWDAAELDRDADADYDDY